MSSPPTEPAPPPAPQPVRPEDGRLRFGVFELSLDAGELRKSGAVVRLRQQPFKVLAFLATRPRQVISREELRTRLWGDDTFVDFDQGINYCIKEVRAALGDSADAPLYIETLPRRGYRFLAPIEPLEAPAAQTPPPPSAAPATPLAPRSRLRLWSLAHAALTVAALGVASWLALEPEPPLLQWRRVSFRRGTVAAARFAPGGELVYSAAWNGGPVMLYAAHPGIADARELPIAGARLLSVSAQGELAYLQSRPQGFPVLWRAPLAGGPGKPLMEDVVQGDAGVGGELAVVRMVPREGARLEWPLGHRLALINSPSHLRLSPDGALLALIEHPRGGDDLGHLLVFDRQGQVVRASRTYASMEGLAWRADSRAVFFTAAEVGSDLALLALDMSGGERTLLPASGRLVVHDAAPDGRLLLERAVVRGEIEHLDAEGRWRELSWFDASRGVALSTDGRALLLSESGEAGGPDYAIYLRPTDGSPPLRLGSGVPFALSPDGRFALAVPLGTPERIELLPTGPGATRELRFTGIIQYDWAALTPDGARLVFVGREEGHNMRVWVGEASGGRARAVTPDGLVIGRNTISPDGARLIGPCPPLSFCIYPLDGGAPQPIQGLQGAVPIGWEPSGHAIYVRPRSGVTWSIERLDLATGERTLWKQLALRDPVGVGALGEVVLSGDGRTLAFNYTRRLSELYVAGPLH